MIRTALISIAVGFVLSAPASADARSAPASRPAALLSIDQGVDPNRKQDFVEFAQAGNQPPQIRRIAPQRVEEGTALNFGIPLNQFNDPDGNARDLTITVRERPNVGWLKITGRRLRGTPRNLAGGTKVRVIAVDPGGEHARRDFTVSVVPKSLDDDAPPGQSNPTTNGNGTDDSTEPSISRDGRFVAYVFGNTEPEPPEQSIVVRDFTVAKFSDRGGSFTVAGPRIRIFEDDVLFSSPSISADGRVVAHVRAGARKVVVRVVRITDSEPLRLRTEFLQDIRDFADPVERDRLVSSTEISLSADGRIVAFEECATTIELCAAEQGTNIVVAKIGAGSPPLVIENGSSPSISRDGRRLAYERRTMSGEQKVIITTLNDRHTEVVRTRNAGPGSNPAVSADGRFVAFERSVNGVRHIFVYNYSQRTTALVSVDADGDPAEGNSSDPSLSENGSRVAFELGISDSGQCFFETACPQILARDLDAAGRPRGELRIVSVDERGNPGDDINGFGSSAPSLSADGRFVTFESFSTNLVPGGADENGSEDNAGSAVFVAPTFPDYAPAVDF